MRNNKATGKEKVQHKDKDTGKKFKGSNGHSKAD